MLKLLQDEKQGRCYIQAQIYFIVHTRIILLIKCFKSFAILTRLCWFDLLCFFFETSRRSNDVRCKTSKLFINLGPHTMVFGKTRMFVFLEIGIIWSSLRIKCPNLRFKYFHFFWILISKYFKNNEISGWKILCPAEDCFLFGNFSKT